MSKHHRTRLLFPPNRVINLIRSQSLPALVDGTCTPVQWRPPWDFSKTNLDYTPNITLSIFPLKMADKTKIYSTNTIVGGFTGGGKYISLWRKYARQVLSTNVISHALPNSSQGKTRVNIISPLDPTYTMKAW